MILTSSHLYLGSLPKTATTATEAALKAIWPDVRVCMKGEDDKTISGHVRAWQVPEEVRARRTVFATTCSPMTWYKRVYLHAADTRSPNMLESLQAYGDGRMDFASVLYGMTHPWLVTLPRQALLVQPVPETQALVYLQTKREGLWSFAHRYYLGADCPKPGVPTRWAHDELIDSRELAARLPEVVGQPLEAPRKNERRAEIRDWLEGQYDHREAQQWVLGLDCDVGAMLGADMAY